MYKLRKYLFKYKKILMPFMRALHIETLNVM